MQKVCDDHDKHLQEQGEGYPAILKPWQSFSGWLEGVDGVATIFEAARGKSIWSCVAENVDEFCNSFNEAMAVDSRVVSTALVLSTECRPCWRGLTSLVDVGGGTGIMGRAIAEAF
ncbi:hypothetical protein Sjap_000384 [Stephania japonica]|uniref:O-methyltransferase C-terminal domain-containing protein n=1 Tax=Stephania japonica TaxID=461633 RepID=A0AAP0PSF0_9MAGN